MLQTFISCSCHLDPLFTKIEVRSDYESWLFLGARYWGQLLKEWSNMQNNIAGKTLLIQNSEIYSIIPRFIYLVWILSHAAIYLAIGFSGQNIM